MYDEGVVVVQVDTLDFVLLGPLVVLVVAELAGERDLRVVVDVAADQELADLAVQRVGRELHGAVDDNLDGEKNVSQL